MGWWGKVFGGAFGFVLGGPLGGMLGAVLGHNVDKGLKRGAGADFSLGSQERTQTAFFAATFSVMGHLAKADGRVSENEIALATAVMDQMELDAAKRRAAIHLFNEGKSPGFRLDAVLEQFRHECHRRQSLIRLFIEIQLQAAYADGELDAVEERILLHICRRLGFSENSFRSIEHLIRAEIQHRRSGSTGAPGGRKGAPPPRRSDRMNLDTAYSLLNVPRQAEQAEVKRAYRRLISQHHPDKLVAKGMPEEMMKLATQKTQEIRQAYEAICEARGW